MAHLDDLVTNELIGETSNYAYTSDNLIKVEFKQTYEVVPDKANFKWLIKSSLYVRMLEDSSPTWDGLLCDDISLNISNDTVYLSTGTTQRGDLSSTHFNINKNTGVEVNGNIISTDVWAFTKILEYVQEYNLNDTHTGRLAIRLRLLNYNRNSGYDNSWYFNDHSNIYLTLPPFSGMQLKLNNKYLKTMPFVKINNEWKPALQYIKVNGEWKLSEDNWIWNP